MSEVVDGAQFRLVRDEDQGLYLFQVGADGAFRTMSVMKLGKLDKLRKQAQEEQAQQSSGTTA
jgi:hypothetical protein